MSTPLRLPTRRSPAARLLLVCLFIVESLAAEPVTEGQTVKLPTMTVTDSAALPELESWHYGRITGFEVLSNASENETRKLLADFQKFQQAVQLMWPAPIKPLAAASMVLCGRGNQYDRFVSRTATADAAVVPSLFVRNREQVAIIVDLQTEQLSINDPTALINTGAATVDYQVDHYRQLYREYVHYLLSQGEVRPPAWLEEGLAQIIMDIELREKTLIYGKIDSHRGEATGGSPLEAEENDASVAGAVVGEQPFNVVLQRRKFIPFGQFLALTHDAPEAKNPLGNNLWAKQAYAFVHFCLFGENLRHKEALTTFVGRLTREPLSEALFKDCFKIGYTDMEKQLRAYLRHTKHKYQQYNLQPDDRLKADAIELTDATATHVGLLKGDALRLTGQPGAALAEYRMAYLRGSRDPALLAALGQTESDASVARRHLDDAIKAGTNRPSAYVAQARLRLADFQTDPGPDGKLTNTQVAAVLTPLFKARSFSPPLPETYATIAAAWKLSSVAPKPEHLAVLDEGIRRFPRDTNLIIETVELYRLAGAPANATAVGQVGLRFATEPASRARLEQILATLPTGGQ